MIRATNTNILIKFLLLFCKKRQKIDNTGIARLVTITKNLFGKTYFVDRVMIPVEHPNCKSHFNFEVLDG